MDSALAPKVTEFLEKTDRMLPRRLVETINCFAQFLLSSTVSISEEEGLNSLYVTFPLHTGYRDAGIFETSQLTLDVLKSQAANKNARRFSIFYSPKIGQSRAKKLS